MPGRDGRDAVSPTVRGTWRADAEYRALDIVAKDGGCFIAKCDTPGVCPGPDWQIVELVAPGAKRASGVPKGSGDRRSGRSDDRRLADRSRQLYRDAGHDRWQRGTAARIARAVRAVSNRNGRMKTRRPLTPEVIAARIDWRVAQLRVLAAATAVAYGRERLSQRLKALGIPERRAEESEVPGMRGTSTPARPRPAPARETIRALVTGPCCRALEFWLGAANGLARVAWRTDAIPKWHPLRHTEFATIRLRLLKIAASIIETASRIRIALASCCPDAETFSLVALALKPSGP